MTMIKLDKNRHNIKIENKSVIQLETIEQKYSKKKNSNSKILLRCAVRGTL